jgi:pilus assembly protein Flp/PilA
LASVESQSILASESSAGGKQAQRKQEDGGINPMFERFIREEEGATMVEYALMLALIAIVCITAVTLIGNRANSVFNSIANSLPASGS